MGENGDEGDGSVPEEKGGRDMSGESGDGGGEGATEQAPDTLSHY